MGRQVLHESTWSGDRGSDTYRALDDLGLDPEVEEDRLTFRRPFPGFHRGLLTDAYPGDELVVMGPASDPRVVVTTPPPPPPER
jgi:hypothetical protein